jgi:general secretion pathway protein C
LLRTLTIQRLRIARLPSDVAVWLKALLIAGLAVQTARLFWVVLTPVGPLGDWRPAAPALLPPNAQSAIIAAVNPFDRQAQAAATPAGLPSDLKLFGVRDDVGGSGGGAIIGLPDGSQVSVSIGEPVIPGVTLVGVGFDYADVDRQGARQRLFLDEDKPPQTISAGGAVTGAIAPAAAGGALTADALRRAVSLTPRQAGAGISGIIVNPDGDNTAYAATGFRPGDVIVAVNGARISSATDFRQLQQAMVPGANLSLSVERGGQIIALNLKLAGSQ